MSSINVMKLVILLAMVMLSGCLDEADPMPDASLPSGLDVPIGGSCSEFWCAGYFGVCSENVCRSQCSPVDYPHCPGSQHDVVAKLPSGDSCACVPD